MSTQTAHSEFDALLEELNKFRSGMRDTGDRLGIEELIDKVLEKCRLAMENGEMAARDYFKLKGLVERRRQQPPAEMAKALTHQLQTGQAGLCEVFSRAKMMSGPESQLGAWWESSYFQRA